MRPPDDGHEWLCLEDNEGSEWLFDVTFLLSDFRCIYGRGCESIAPGDVKRSDATKSLGCCTHGAHIVDEEDLSDVHNAIRSLTSADWQYMKRAKKNGPLKKNRSGSWMTRKADGACIFLNRSNFKGGAGCALHRAAERVGDRPLDWKPDVCWQVPIRLDVHEDDYGNETVFVRAWKRKDWGPGGDDFGWWCTEEENAYQNGIPLFETASDELEELVGSDLYLRLASALQKRISGTPVKLSSPN